MNEPRILVWRAPDAVPVMSAHAPAPMQIEDDEESGLTQTSRMRRLLNAMEPERTFGICASHYQVAMSRLPRPGCRG